MFSHVIPCTWVYNFNFMSVFLPQPFFDKIVSTFFSYRKTQTQAGIFIWDQDVFTFAVDSKNVITPLVAVWTLKVPWHFQKYFVLWSFCRTQTCSFIAKYSANVDGIVLRVSLCILRRKSGLGDGHRSFYYCGSNVLHFNSAFQIMASYKVPEVVITWCIVEI